VSIKDWLMGRQVKTLEDNRDRLEAQCEALRGEVISLEGDKDRMREQVSSLETKVRRLEEEAEKKEREQKLADDEVKHRLKVREEQLELSTERTLMEKDREHQAALAEAERGYQRKITEGLENRHGELREMYSEILERLPNVNWRIADGDRQADD
jgi:chromosome segregation ATPase